MTLFSFNALRTLFTRKEKESSVFMWEDDFGQVELIPVSNKSQAEEEALLIADFSKKHRTENGFTDIYMRESLPFDRLPLKLIPVNSFEELMLDCNLKRIRYITYSGGGIINYKLGQTRAYGDTAFAIWIEIRDGVIENIWLTSYGNGNDERRINQISEMLFRLSTVYNLIIADWNCGAIIDPSNLDELNHYLQEVY